MNLHFFELRSSGFPAVEFVRRGNPPYFSPQIQDMPTSYEQVTSALQPRLLQVSQYAGEVSLTTTVENLRDVLSSLKNEFGFNYLTDIATVDHYSDAGRFEVNYNLINIEQHQRIRVKVRVEEDAPEVPSVVDLWPSANWLEREGYDMMGIVFTGHPDLRRIFMPEDFKYFPHRKEFPLIGIPGSIQVPEKDGPKGYR
jgi:NADH-quinone oxidoreductase subunit C